MSTTRSIRATAPGPSTIRTSLPTVDLKVLVEDDRTYAEVVLTTADDSGPSADLVNSATLEASGADLFVRVVRDSGVTFVSGGSTVSIGGGTVVIGSGTVMVNGRIVSGGGATTIVVQPVRAIAYVPPASRVHAEAQSGDVTTQGPLRHVSASTQSGDVEVGEVETVNARTMSGGIHAGPVGRLAELSSMSGDITVSGPPTATAAASSMAGDISSYGGIRTAGSSMSGRVRNR